MGLSLQLSMLRFWLLVSPRGLAVAGLMKGPLGFVGPTCVLKQWDKLDTIFFKYMDGPQCYAYDRITMEALTITAKSRHTQTVGSQTQNMSAGQAAQKC